MAEFDLMAVFPEGSRFEFQGRRMRVVAHQDNNWGTKKRAEPRLVAIHEGTNDVVSFPISVARQIAEGRGDGY